MLFPGTVLFAVTSCTEADAWADGTTLATEAALAVGAARAAPGRRMVWLEGAAFAGVAIEEAGDAERASEAGAEEFAFLAVDVSEAGLAKGTACPSWTGLAAGTACNQGVTGVDDTAWALAALSCSTGVVGSPGWVANKASVRSAGGAAGTVEVVCKPGKAK